jgi:hypothetical protein
LSRKFFVNIRIAAVVCAAALLASAPVAAQGTGRAGRPFRGLFGPAERDPAHILFITGEVGAGYDDDVVSERLEHGLASTTGSIREVSATYGLFAGGLRYANYGRRHQLGASLQSIARSYSQYGTVSAHSAALSGSLRAGRRTTLSGSQSVTYQPFGMLFSYQPIIDQGIGQLDPPNPEFGAIHSAYTTLNSGASLLHQLSRRSSITSSYTYSSSFISGSSDRFRSQQATIRYGYSMTRHFGWHAGYGYGESQYPGGVDRYRSDSIDAGVDYSRELSLTRQTSLFFSTGMIGIKDRSFDRRIDSRYVVTGTAQLRREIGRTWQAAAVYTRGVTFFETIRVPYIYDGLTLSLTGLIARRLEFHSSAGATYGSLGVYDGSSGPNRFSNLYANAGLLFALSRYMALAGEYIVYGYSIDDPSVITHGFLRPEMTRNTIVVSLRAWAPLLERGRRPNAPR